ncbi:unnamed protein product [Vitrella brassicaformis CCMP3155]|uniref:Uncharacterized protein n=5 Tax=Vitrella brassicaformis TaxID=1169539 RepID=A0A0G4EPC8_VITBC|nr:unnamed protein product [Vitrella brassicaformis CCMP3155]|eukprot:CEL99047.1 unnamed protein product [Vitrella brassicaformis CCMP3155]
MTEQILSPSTSSTSSPPKSAVRRLPHLLTQIQISSPQEAIDGPAWLPTAVQNSAKDGGPCVVRLDVSMEQQLPTLNIYGPLCDGNITTRHPSRPPLVQPDVSIDKLWDSLTPILPSSAQRRKRNRHTHRQTTNGSSAGRRRRRLPMSRHSDAPPPQSLTRPPPDDAPLRSSSGLWASAESPVAAGREPERGRFWKWLTGHVYGALAWPVGRRALPPLAALSHAEWKLLLSFFRSAVDYIRTPLGVALVNPPAPLPLLQRLLVQTLWTPVDATSPCPSLPDPPEVSVVMAAEALYLARVLFQSFFAELARDADRDRDTVVPREEGMAMSNDPSPVVQLGLAFVFSNAFMAFACRFIALLNLRQQDADCSASTEVLVTHALAEAWGECGYDVCWLLAHLVSSIFREDDCASDRGMSGPPPPGSHLLLSSGSAPPFFQIAFASMCHCYAHFQIYHSLRGPAFTSSMSAPTSCASPPAGPVFISLSDYLRLFSTLAFAGHPPVLQHTPSPSNGPVDFAFETDGPHSYVCESPSLAICFLRCVRDVLRCYVRDAWSSHGPPFHPLPPDPFAPDSDGQVSSPVKDDVAAKRDVAQLAVVCLRRILEALTLSISSKPPQSESDSHTHTDTASPGMNGYIASPIVRRQESGAISRTLSAPVGEGDAADGEGDESTLLRIARRKLEEMRMPPIDGETDQLRYRLSDLRVTSFTTKDCQVRVQSVGKAWYEHPPAAASALAARQPQPNRPETRTQPSEEPSLPSSGPRDGPASREGQTASDGPPAAPADENKASSSRSCYCRVSCVKVGGSLRHNWVASFVKLPLQEQGASVVQVSDVSATAFVSFSVEQGLRLRSLTIDRPSVEVQLTCTSALSQLLLQLLVTIFKETLRTQLQVRMQQGLEKLVQRSFELFNDSVWKRLRVLVPKSVLAEMICFLDTSIPPQGFSL